MTTPQPLVLRQDATDASLYRAVEATVEPDKYRLETEGDLFRLIATRQIGQYPPGTRGGLVSDRTTLDRSDDSWIDAGSKATGVSKVSGNSNIVNGASLHDSTVRGHCFISNSVLINAAVVDCAIDGSQLKQASLTRCKVTDSDINLWIMSDCSVNGTKMERDPRGYEQMLTYARLLGAHALEAKHVFSVSTRHGLLTLARADNPSGFVITVGCQRYESMERFIAGARHYGISKFEDNMLEPLCVMLRAAVDQWKAQD